jgi:hypothetical protein
MNPTLAETQRALIAHAHGESGAVHAWLRAQPENARGFGVHARNSRANLREALGAVFPVVAALVGPACFRGLAQRYVALTPSQSADIHAYGAGFAEFVAASRAQRHLDYLVDVARLEWAWHACYHAPDEPMFDVTALRDAPGSEHGQLRFRLAQHCHLVTCRYAALSIWEQHQAHTAADALLLAPPGRHAYIVYRDGDLPRISADRDHAFLVALAEGRTLAQAFDAADSEAGALGRWIRAGVIAGLVSDA